ncbi:M90 family metallopeptidase [Salinibacter altiplanensis]|uniref:M90 family metallopeptidase n=1 Tax=Salinibacter altiplanensis TaxID=1803181 RepID=UPI000C9FE0EB|nr:M90 family metallopeptidase [Salinibacter altiplanensis]
MRIVRRSSMFTTGLLALIFGGGGAVVGHEVTSVGPALGLAPAAVVLVVGLWRPWRRWRVAQTDLLPAHRQWIQERVPLYQKLDSAGRARFERDVQFALDEYSFEGVQGVTGTDPLRLSVAAGIAVLLHGRPSWELPGSRSVLFYPERFDETYHGNITARYDGMAHQQGPLILTVAAVRRSWEEPGDGNNVVLHELAHLFDFDNEGADGVPSLVDPGSAPDWQALVREEMRRIREGRSLLRPYGAEAPSEFFAVAVEHFFEQPVPMARRHDELFRALVSFFRVDPRTGAVGAAAVEAVVEAGAT